MKKEILIQIFLIILVLIILIFIYQKYLKEESNDNVAINKDEEAPIFQLADLGIVGDTLSVIPKINQNL